MADADDDPLVQTSIRLPASLVAELREVAKRDKRTQTSIIESALEEYLQRNEGSGLPDELVKAVEGYLKRHRQP